MRLADVAARHPLSSVWPRQPGDHLGIPAVSRVSMASSEDGGDGKVIVEKVHQIRTAGQPQGMVVPADMVVSAEGKDYMKILLAATARAGLRDGCAACSGYVCCCGC